ncbi:MAG: IclR family transcriptional regulator [Homoserinimonas sp.]|jgi:IclR family acetate operon transcriptional repressor|nr:IclR family transcriptional regulator [Homoserinimonas sp.]
MRNPEIQRKPPYPLASVDNALKLLQLLRDTGTLRLKDAAAELGVAPSTAHRLLAMLIYRGFAIQDDSRNYVSGAAMGEGPAGLSSTRQLRLLAQPHLEMLAGQLNETANLVIRVGVKVRFLSTVEGTNLLRVGDRRGAILPAHTSSSGKAILAELPADSLAKLFRSQLHEELAETEYRALLKELEQVRQHGFATNYEGTEEGVSALGAAIHDGSGRAVAAISVATPVNRFQKLVADNLVAAVLDAATQIEVDLSSHPIEL